MKIGVRLRRAHRALDAAALARLIARRRSARRLAARPVRAGDEFPFQFDEREEVER